MEGVKIISVSELLQRSRPLTGASSFPSPPSPATSISPNSSETNRKYPSSDETSTASDSFNASVSDQNPNPRILGSLKYQALIIGTLNLPASDDDPPSNLLSCGSKNGCFTFSDGSSRVCCDVLDLDVRIIGEKIHILAWNFIPFKCGGGFLEIIRWSLPDSTAETGQCSGMDSFLLASASPPASKEHFKTRSCVHGSLESVSPVSVIPCTVQSSSQQSSSPKSLRGFLAEIMVCDCYLCSSKASVAALHHSCQGKNLHSFNRPVSVYFYGSASIWHPVLSKLLGNVVSLTDMKKKMVFIGKEESYPMFVTTDKAVLHIPRTPIGKLPYERTVIKGRGESGVYTGIVTGVYMQGMVVELDEKVWLLLTDQALALPHPLRVGALISLRNVHFVHPKFSWTKLLLLGACFKTTISVKSFSPLESQCLIQSQTQSLLRKFIETFAFSARLWVLLMVSCFRKKFAGIFSEKEILGSRHQEGLVQMYASLCLPSCVFRPRHGVFKEFSKHDRCGCGSEPNYGCLKLVVPISDFLSHCEVMWINMLLQMDNDSEIMEKSNHCRLLSCEGKPYGRLIRRIISSEDVGVILMGTLEISPSSGRLQLTDATGSVEVVVPDLPSNWDVRSIYEVQYYSLVLEGLPAQVNSLGLLKKESFSCRSIFHHVLSMREINTLVIYVHFYTRNSTFLNVPWRSPSCMGWSGNFKGLESGRFHLLLVTHKFPAMQNFQCEQIISNRSTMFAEAIILPWDLYLPLKNGDTYPTEVSNVNLIERIKYNVHRNCPENVCNKRAKIAQESGEALTSRSMDNPVKDGKGSDGYLNNCCSPYWEFSTSQKSSNSSYPLEMPCFVTFRSFNDHKLLRAGILCCTSAIAVDSVVVKASAQKVLLEFKPESFFKYQLLQIGGYYILKYPKEELQCDLKYRGYASCGKGLVTSKTPLWSFSFSSDEGLSHSEPLEYHPSDVSSTSIDAILLEGSPRSELLFQRSPIESLESCSDVHLYLSADAMNVLKIGIEALEEGLIRPVVAPAEAIDISAFIGTEMTVPVLSSRTPGPYGRLPEGNLISLHGNVMDVHNFDCNSLGTQMQLGCETMGDVCQLTFYQGIPSSICIHISKDCHIVKIRGTLCKHAYPIGMGPGVSATFHRVLVLGQHELMLTPVSFIVINSIKEVDNHCSDKCFNPEYGSDLYDALQDSVPSGLISDFIRCLESRPMQFHCRVVAIYTLVLENPKRKFEKLQPKERSKAPIINIPLASFILDDGSSLCCCWASAEKAVKLLRLHEEIPVRTFSNSCWRLKRTGSDKTPSTNFYHLGKILKQHNRVIVKNHGAMLDSPCQELAFSVDSDKVLSISGENLLKFIILNACSGSVLSVAGSLMDSNAIEQLEMELTKMEMSLPSMQNIWVREVQHVNHLADAKNMIQELLMR